MHLPFVFLAVFVAAVISWLVWRYFALVHAEEKSARDIEARKKRSERRERRRQRAE